MLSKEFLVFEWNFQFNISNFSRLYSYFFALGVCCMLLPLGLHGLGLELDCWFELFWPFRFWPIADILDKLENLQDFFIHELSDVRAEIRNITRSKIPDLTENKLSNNTDLLEKQIIFLKEECQSKNLIINILLEQLFQTATSKSLNTDNSDRSSKTVPDDCY